MPRRGVAAIIWVMLCATACTGRIYLWDSDGLTDAGPGPDSRWWNPDSTTPGPDGSVASPDGAVPGPDGWTPPGPDAAIQQDSWVPPQPDAETPPDSSVTGPDSGTTGLPGDDVVFLTLNELNSRTDSSWGTVLTDIVQHCEPGNVDYYSDTDKITHGHETTHANNAYIRNYMNNTGQTANGFYVLQDRAVVVIEPDIWKHDVAPYVPQVLQGFRYSTYITGQTAWDDTPLYVWDEWVAYANGTAIGVNLVNSGMWSYGWRDACAGTIEFVAYSIAVGMAVRDLDPTYFNTYVQFREFLAWHLRISMDLFRECRVMSDFSYATQDTYYQDLRTHAQAADMRQFIIDTYGAAFALDVLEF